MIGGSGLEGLSRLDKGVEALCSSHFISLYKSTPRGVVKRWKNSFLNSQLRFLDKRARSLP